MKPISVRRAILLAAACFGILYSAIPAAAQITIYAQEVGPDVVFTVSGSIDPGTPDRTNFYESETFFDSNLSSIKAWQSDHLVNQYYLVESVDIGGGGSLKDVGIGAGDNFSITISVLTLDDDYVANSPINTTLTFPGTTFADLFVDVEGGPYVWTVINSSATITLQFSPPATSSVATTNSAPLDFTAVKNSLKKKIKKLKKKAQQARKRGGLRAAKNLLKNAKKLQKKLKALG